MNKKALERKKRFLEMKEAAGGAAGIFENVKKKTYRLFFVESGDITCITIDETLVPKPNWKTSAGWDQEQLKEVYEAGAHKYYVQTSDHNIDRFDIKRREELVYTYSADEDFVFDIPDSDKEADVHCVLTEKDFTVKLADTTKSLFDAVEPNNSAIKGSKYLLFYITDEKNPHIMLQTIKVDLKDLINPGDKVIVSTNDNYSRCSVFTQRLFDTYSIKRIKNGKG